MLVLIRFEADPADDGFEGEAVAVLAILAERPGFVTGQLTRSYDDTRLWCLATEWESVGAYRRALGSYEVKAGATPLLARALPEPSAFEPLASAGPGGPVRSSASDRSIASRP